MRQSSESLAGRVAYLELGPLTAGEAGPDDDDLVFPLVGRIDELDPGLVVAPLVGERAGGNLGVEFGHGGKSVLGGSGGSHGGGRMRLWGEFRDLVTHLRWP